MGYVLFTDSSSNITPDLAAEWDARIVSLYYALDGAERPAYDPDLTAIASTTRCASAPKSAPR